jgi:hypothetical protein
MKPVKPLCLFFFFSVEHGICGSPNTDSLDGHPLTLSMPSSDHGSQPHSPETLVADYLRVIGDRVYAEHGAALDRAVQDLQCMPREQITYDILRNTAVSILTHVGAPESSGWYKVSSL